MIRDRPGLDGLGDHPRLHWSRPWDEIQPFMQRQANGETMAHLVLLELHARVRRVGHSPAHFVLVAEVRSTGGTTSPAATTASGAIGVVP